ncbi:hypothetical protein FQA39_LY07777 [Lamprigera yunnana]|nr:hypothetical protein FQA39_LY07777 [Lamprigera yunnana]
MFKLLLSVLLFQTVLSALVVPEQKRSLKVCVNKILTRFIANDAIVLYMYNTSGNAPPPHPIMNPIINFDVGKYHFQMRGTFKLYSDVVIIDASSSDSFEDTWNILFESEIMIFSTLHNIKFIIILPITEISYVHEVLRNLWTFDIVNIFFILYNFKLKNDMTLLITGDPLDPRNRCGSKGGHLTGQSCENVSKSPLLEMSKNYRNCRMIYLHHGKLEEARIRSLSAFASLYILDIIHKVINITIVPERIYDDNIKIIRQQLADFNISIIMTEGMASFFKDDDKEYTLYNKIKRKMILLSDDEYTDTMIDNSVVTPKNYATMISRNDLYQIISAFNMKFQYFADNSLFGKVSFILSPNTGSSIFHPINKITTTLLESGLIDFEVTKFERAMKNNSNYDNSVDSTVEDKVVLTLSHVYPIFVFWGAGIIISTVVFFAEIFKHRMEEKLEP